MGLGSAARGSTSRERRVRRSVPNAEKDRAGAGAPDDEIDVARAKGGQASNAENPARP